MQLDRYPIRSRLLARQNDVTGNETSAESTASDQNTAESAAVGEVEQNDTGVTEESENESEIVQDAQENQTESEESGVTSDSSALDHNLESEDHQENIVQDAQFEMEGSEEQDAERSENVKEVIKEIILTNQPESDIQVIQTVPEMELLISNDDYRVMSILLLSAVLGAIVATALLNVINRGL